MKIHVTQTISDMLVPLTDEQLSVLVSEADDWQDGKDRDQNQFSAFNHLCQAVFDVLPLSNGALRASVRDAAHREVARRFAQSHKVAKGWEIETHENMAVLRKDGGSMSVFRLDSPGKDRTVCQFLKDLASAPK